MRLQKVNNATFEEESALINVDTNEVIAKGDYYHDKIDEYIDGILHGLTYAGIEYEKLENISVTPNMNLFDICDFYNEESYLEEDISDEEEQHCELEQEVPEIEENTIEGVKLLPHEIKHHFEICSAKTIRAHCNIIEALQKTRNCEGDLFCVDNDEFHIVYSCFGLEYEDNNELLKNFGVMYDDENKLMVIKP